MTDNDDVAPGSGWAYIAGAIAAGILSLMTYATAEDVPDWITMALLGTAGLLAAIGATAIGVTTGIRRADYLRDRSASR